jgi:hypothetical protein
MIYAAKQAGVDVINMSIGGLPSLNDGNNTRAVLYNRLIDESKVEMFLSAGNSYAGINSVGDPSVATDAMSVGAYVHADTWFDNYGAVAVKADGLFPFSSRGPSEAGALKPQIIAPGSAVSCVPAWAPNFPLVGPLPIGYDMFNGTSMAAPQAAGAAALLISAAKQNNAQFKPDQLRQAINSSARYIAGYGAYEQGNGLIQVPAAWDLLKTNIKTVGITSVAPVDTVLKGFLATPGFGTGIYEREGWAPGSSGSRNIVFTRTTGGSKPVTYNLSWLGNDGTFSSAGSVALGLNNAASVAVNINAATPGAHSAILRLDDPSTTGIDYEVLKHDRRRGPVQRRQQLLGQLHRLDRPRRHGLVLLERPRGRAGVQDRRHRHQRAHPLPPLPPVRRRDRLHCVGLPDRRHADAHAVRAAAGRVGGDGGNLAHRGSGAVDASPSPVPSWVSRPRRRPG